MPLFNKLLRKLRSLARPNAEPYPRGHFYSPLPNLADVRNNAAAIFRTDVDLDSSINLRDSEQVDLLQSLAGIIKTLSFPAAKTADRRYYADNPFFGLGSAFLTAAMIVHLRPKRIIEIGSGFSSAMMLDINDQHSAGAVLHTFVEPYPERLRELMRPGDLQRHRLLQIPVQQVPLAEFQRLEANDVLFVDSSHVSKVGSDLNHILFNVLPALRPGVVVHFHDIYWPFEYPREWIINSKRAWNECYILRAFLQYNDAFEIALYPQYLRHKHATLMRELWPAWWQEPGSALWIRKLK
jgi:predicted O-methyltransferase YrrM